MTRIMAPGDRVAAEAALLIGTPFRLRGRDPATGLDCIGLAATAMHRAGIAVAVPAQYALRNRDIGSCLRFGAQAGLTAVSGAFMPGDLVLVIPGPAQHHLIIAAHARSYIHAHAGLRRVVLSPGPPTWPIAAHWRPICGQGCSN